MLQSNAHQKELPTLKVREKDSRLFYSTSSEEAEVIISRNNRIERVIHRDLIKEKEFQVNCGESHFIVVGSGNCEREVYHFLLPSNESHLQIRLGQTIHRGEGTWSSLPHDFENYPEKGFEEAFYYLLSGGTKKGIQVGRGLWGDGSAVDAIWAVKDRQFSNIPMGFHPVVGEPGVQVGYIWAYLAKKKEWEKVKR